MPTFIYTVCCSAIVFIMGIGIINGEHIIIIIIVFLFQVPRICFVHVSAN